jgi:hypothetical protein
MFMKKFAASILLTLYFVVSTGFTVNLHFCMDKFHSWELGTSKKDSCEKCGMSTQKSNGCCRDEVKVMKLQQDQVMSATAVYLFSAPAVPVALVPEFLLPVIKAISSQEDRIHGPPLLSKQDTYLNNCVFRL